jgi:hypothetical protein
MTAPTPDAVGDDLVCSARGCGTDATWGVLWNNPRLHTPVRRKVWLACDEHRGHLEEYLGVRGFWKSTVPVAELPRLDLGERPGLGLPGLGLPGPR